MKKIETDCIIVHFKNLLAYLQLFKVYNAWKTHFFCHEALNPEIKI